MSLTNFIVGGIIGYVYVHFGMSQCLITNITTGDNPYRWKDEMCLEEATFTVERISNDQLNAKHAHSLLLLYLLYGIWSANNQHLPLWQGQQSMISGTEMSQV